MMSSKDILVRDGFMLIESMSPVAKCKEATVRLRRDRRCIRQALKFLSSHGLVPVCIDVEDIGIVYRKRLSYVTRIMIYINHGICRHGTNATSACREALQYYADKFNL